MINFIRSAGFSIFYRFISLLSSKRSNFTRFRAILMVFVQSIFLRIPTSAFVCKFCRFSWVFFVHCARKKGGTNVNKEQENGIRYELSWFASLKFYEILKHHEITREQQSILFVNNPQSSMIRWISLSRHSRHIKMNIWFNIFYHF